MSDHRSTAERIGAAVLGAVLLAVGVTLGVKQYGDLAWTALAAVLAVAGIGCLRYALIRSRRSRRG